MQLIKHAFGSLLRGTVAAIAASKERRAIRELHSFDGRTLADIGITRGEIEFAVRHGRPSKAKVVPFSVPSKQRKANAPASRERTPPLHVILLILGLVPFGAVLSWGNPQSETSMPPTKGEIRMNDHQDWKTVYEKVRHRAGKGAYYRTFRSPVRVLTMTSDWAGLVRIWQFRHSAMMRSLRGWPV